VKHRAHDSTQNITLVRVLMFETQVSQNSGLILADGITWNEDRISTRKKEEETD
jgi:hypothetical protein